MGVNKSDVWMIGYVGIYGTLKNYINRLVGLREVVDGIEIIIVKKTAIA